MGTVRNRWSFAVSRQAGLFDIFEDEVSVTLASFSRCGGAFYLPFVLCETISLKGPRRRDLSGWDVRDVLRDG